MPPKPDYTLDRHLPSFEPHQNSYMHLLGGLLKHTQLCAPEHRVSSKITEAHLTGGDGPAVLDAAEKNTIQLNFEKDLCNRLEQQSLQDKILQLDENCLGYLEVPDATCKAILYFEANKPISQSVECVTLAQFMTAARGSISGRLMPYEAIKLARQLATAVLQFHSTPILGSSFESSSVVFYRSSDDMETSRLSLGTPHLTVYMHSYEAESTTIGDESEEAVLIRNPHLFSLGIILVELAFQMPLSDLHSEYPAHQSSHSKGKFGDCMLAERISRDHVSRELGSKYKENVRKCLGCDFGLGNDLSDPKLQDAFYRDVIYELNKHEKELARFWGA